MLACDSGCPANDAVCERDWIGFEAIAQLHAQIDDDHNGSLDRSESDEVSVITVLFFFEIGICLYLLVSCFQCIDAVGWVAGRASGL